MNPIGMALVAAGALSASMAFAQKGETVKIAWPYAFASKPAPTLDHVSPG